jgi:hypothetical protein
VDLPDEVWELSVYEGLLRAFRATCGRMWVTCSVLTRMKSRQSESSMVHNG